jgi:hypothetical protein
MGTGQAQIDPGDEALVALLVPARQSRVRTATIVAALAVILVLVLVVAGSGLLAPRAAVEMDSATTDGKTATVTFTVHNDGWTSIRLVSFDASADGLASVHAALPKSRTIPPGKSVEVRVVATLADCERLSNSHQDSVRLRVTNGIGATVAQTENVRYISSWLESLTASCSSVPQASG